MYDTKQDQNLSGKRHGERRRVEWLEGGLARCRHRHAPWPLKGRGRGPGLPSITTLTLLSSPFLPSLTHFLPHSTILPLPLILPWSPSSAPINQSLTLPPPVPPSHPQGFSHLHHPSLPLFLYIPSSSSLPTPLCLFSSLEVQWE